MVTETEMAAETVKEMVKTIEALLRKLMKQLNNLGTSNFVDRG